MATTRQRIFAALLPLALLGGCESFGRGVTQAVLDGSGSTGEDTRSCEVEGRPFPGIEPFLEAQDKLPPFVEGDSNRPEVKVLFVHGIGTHAPGHGTALRNNLATQLGLEIRAPRPKRIVIAHPEFPGQNLGEINVSRLTDTAQRRDLLFYELTWSPITQPDKDLLAFDKEQDYVLRRAAVNQAMRTFVNDIAPDPLAYAGQKREPILVSVGQSICWVVSRGWSELPELTEGQWCGPDFPGIGSRLELDDFAIITHSLGSRATLDALQRLTNLPIAADPRLKRMADDFRAREVQLFMLSNQLPLLEAGREGQQIVGQTGAYCGPTPAKPGRFFAETQIVAFSDPERPDELPHTGPVRRQVHRLAPVPERDQRHDQRGGGELPARPGRCRQSPRGALGLWAGRSGRRPDCPGCRQPARGAGRRRALHLARDPGRPDALISPDGPCPRRGWRHRSSATRTPRRHPDRDARAR